MSKRKTEKANLENKRKIFLEIGFIITLAAVLIVFEWKSYDYIEYSNIYRNNYQLPEEINLIQIKKEEVIPQKPESFMVINIVTDDTPDDEINIDADFIEEEENGDWVLIIEEEDPVIETFPFVSVQEKPEFPGGVPALMRFVSQHFKVPRVDLEQGINGTMYVRFTIDKNGDVTDIKMLRSISPSCDEEAMRVISMLPKWKPGKQSTRNVAVEYNLPIKVSLM